MFLKEKEMNLFRKIFSLKCITKANICHRCDEYEQINGKNTFEAMDCLRKLAAILLEENKRENQFMPKPIIHMYREMILTGKIKCL